MVFKGFLSFYNTFDEGFCGVPILKGLLKGSLSFSKAYYRDSYLFSRLAKGIPTVQRRFKGIPIKGLLKGFLSCPKSYQALCKRSRI